MGIHSLRSRGFIYDPSFSPFTMSAVGDDRYGHFSTV